MCKYCIYYNLCSGYCDLKNESRDEYSRCKDYEYAGDDYE